MTQSDMILDALKRGEKLTALDALARFRSLRLSGRILELREKGYMIETRMIETPSGKRIAEYSLPMIARGETYPLPFAK